MMPSDHTLPGNPLPPSPPFGTLGRVTRQMVHARTRNLAVKAGRSPLQISQTDYEQARRELTGESDMARQEARLDGAPERGALEPGQSSTPFVERGPVPRHP